MADAPQPGAAVGAGGGAAVAGGRRGAPVARPIPIPRNTNHDLPLKGRSKKEKEQEDNDLQLTQKHRVENEEVNLQNEKLIQIYNDLKNIGKCYAEAIPQDGKKPRVTTEMQRLSGNFSDVLKKIRPQEAAVRSAGGEPIPFPGQVIRKLPNSLQCLMKNLK